MSEASAEGMPPPSRAMSRKAAIVGVGETDYAIDYKAARARAPGYELPTPEGLAKTAFERALADSCLKREDVRPGQDRELVHFRHDYYNGLLPIPWETILVELEEGPLFISNPKGFTWQDIDVNMPVKLAFMACEDSAGPFSLPIFERV